MRNADKIEHIDCYVTGHWCFVAVTTEQGLMGVGEATYFTHPTAIPSIVKDLSGVYRGHDPFATDALYNLVLKKHALRDTAAASAVSAIDQALWDIKGKAFGAPIWQLLGGRVREKVRAILLVDRAQRSEVVLGAAEAASEGFTAIKVKPFLPGWSRQSTARALREVIDIVAEVRETIGWDVDLAVELHRNLTPEQAQQFAEAVKPYLLYFIEDPILPFSMAANMYAAQSLKAPAAAGERLTNIWEFRDLSDCHAASILRPDIGLSGGFTQMRKIAAIAESRHQRIVPHNFLSPVSTVGHIHLAACTPNWDVQGYIREDRAPWTDVVDRINVLKDGFLEIPERPGLGMSLNMDYICSTPYEPFAERVGHTAAIAMDGGVKQI